MNEYFDSFTAKSIVTSYVTVDIINPVSLRNRNVQLILQSGEEKRYKRLPVGSLWKAIGETCTVDIVINKKNLAYYLYPPINIPLNEMPF